MRPKLNRYIIFPLFAFFALIALLTGCEKNVTVAVPNGDEEVVVEGYIETGKNPQVILSRTLPFFGEVNTSNVLQNLIPGATVIVNNGTVNDTLLSFSGYYFSTSMIGEIGKTYTLTVYVNGKTITSVTTIPVPVKLDSVWWKADGQRDSLGFAWGHLTDPDTTGNCYRWFAQRINRYIFGPDSGHVKDSTFIAPIGGSVFEDKFINGRSFDISFPRGSFSFSSKEDDVNDEKFFFKRGDTIVVKFCALDRAHFQFWRSEETQVGNNGNPFGSPAPVTSNIVGGLGIWGGYSPSFDTIIAR